MTPLPPPTRVDEHSRYLWRHILVRDRDTGEAINFVLSADVETGKLSRYEAIPLDEAPGIYDITKNEYGEPLIIHETRNLSIGWHDPDAPELNPPYNRYHGMKLTSLEVEYLTYLMGGPSSNPEHASRFQNIDHRQLKLKLWHLAEQYFFEEYATQSARGE